MDLLPHEEVERALAPVAVRERWADESDSDEGWLGHENPKPAMRKASLACLVERQRQCADVACVTPSVSEPVVAFQTLGVDRIMFGDHRDSDWGHYDNDELLLSEWGETMQARSQFVSRLTGIFDCLGWAEV